MIGLDTNVIVRYLVFDDAIQAEQASCIIEQALKQQELLYINHIVLCELIWVLTRAYKRSKAEIIDVVEKLLLAQGFEIEDRDVIWKTLIDFKNNRADFADCLIGVKNKLAGCKHSYSFDEKALLLANFRQIN